MIYPATTTVGLPNADLPDDIAADYLEARSIVMQSPRGAAALLRLAIDRLCLELGASGGTLDEKIGFLVRNGLPIAVQQALDYTRVIGNSYVHPGQLDVRDDAEIARRLFWCVNQIADKMITDPKEMQAFYDSLPEHKREAIKRRDNGN